MVELELFTHMAEIAGVFVGFGALIAVRSGGASGAFEVGMTRGVVWMGLMTVVAALAPVVISRFGIGAHAVWVLSSILVVLTFSGFIVVNLQTPEYRTNMSARRSRTLDLIETGATALYLGAMLLALAAIVAGVLPDREAALYLMVVVLILLGAAWLLLDLVYAPRTRDTPERR